jgi:hypothetical protein
MQSPLALVASLSLLTAVPLASTSVAGQDALHLTAVPEAVDSAEVRDRARGAQTRFERYRRLHLPSTWGSWGGQCDEVIGRMCMRHGEGDWEPVPESPEIRAAREQLLGELRIAGERIPGDTWITGQRIFYLGEVGRWTEAVHVADACHGGQRGWCDALRGLAYHGAQRFVDAERAFDAALAAMSPELAGRWRDPSPLLEDRGNVLRDAHDTLPPDRLVERAWQLADPFFLKSGNDRLTEHYARHTVSRIRSDSRSAYGMSWGPDLEELLVRYGWEVGWERTRAGPGESRSTGVVGHHHPESLTYMPPAAAIARPAASDEEAWELSPDRPRSAYAPLYAPVATRAAVQIARFWRGDSVLVVAAYRMTPPEDDDRPAGALLRRLDSDVPPDQAVEAGLFLLPETGGAIHAATSTAGPVGRLSLQVPAGSYLASVESLTSKLGRASRTRLGLVADTLPPDVPALSDALLLDAGPGMPETLAAAIDQAWPGNAILPGQPLGVAWEVTGLGPEAVSMAYRLTVVKRDRGLAEKVGSLLGLFGGGPEVQVSWSEQGGGGARREFRATDVDLTALGPGRYRLTLELELPGRSTMAVHRTLRVVE